MSTAAGAEHLDWLHLVTLLLAFTMLCGLWWVYFAFGPATVQAALEESENRIELIRPVLSYAHRRDRRNRRRHRPSRSQSR